MCQCDRHVPVWSSRGPGTRGVCGGATMIQVGPARVSIASCEETGAAPRLQFHRQSALRARGILCRAMLRRHKGKPRRAMLRRRKGKPCRAVVRHRKADPACAMAVYHASWRFAKLQLRIRLSSFRILQNPCQNSGVALRTPSICRHLAHVSALDALRLDILPAWTERTTMRAVQTCNRRAWWPTDCDCSGWSSWSRHTARTVVSGWRTRPSSEAQRDLSLFEDQRRSRGIRRKVSRVPPARSASRNRAV